MNKNLKFWLAIATLLGLQSSLVLAIPDGWKQVVKNPVTDQNVPIDTYIFSKDDDGTKLLTLRIVSKDYSEKNIQTLADELATENGCELEKTVTFNPTMSVIKCTNKERDAEYNFYIKGNHGQSLLIGTFGVTQEEMVLFMDSLSAEKSKTKEGITHE